MFTIKTVALLLVELNMVKYANFMFHKIFKPMHGTHLSFGNGVAEQKTSFGGFSLCDSHNVLY